MLKQMMTSFMTMVSTCADILGNYLNQLPEKALHQKTRVYRPAPWMKPKKTHDASHLNKKVHNHAEGSAHHETKIFNHPRS